MTTYRRKLATAAAGAALALAASALPTQAEARAGSARVEAEIRCLALNVYFEARGEPTLGKFAVAHVTMNRSSDPSFPESVCAVVRQGGDKQRNRCQFSWWCDGKRDHPIDLNAWEESQSIARAVYSGESDDPTGGALWFHTRSVKPTWRREVKRSARIGAHVFYRRPGAPQRVVAARDAQPPADDFAAQLALVKGWNGADVEDGDTALFDLADRPAERSLEVARADDRAFGPGSEAARHGGEVDRRVRHALADPGILGRAAAMMRDLDLMLLVVAPRAVVVDDDQQRDAVVDRRPQRARVHDEVSVPKDRHGELAFIAERQRRADRRSRTVPDAPAAARA